MRVMVIGGNGFLGAHIVRQLVEKAHAVSAFDISPETSLLQCRHGQNRHHA